MVSIDTPSRTTRPRVSSASTANGRTTSSAASKAPSFIACASCLDGAEAPGEDALLGVQPVLGLVEHDRARAVHDLVGDLLAAMRRQAMHEDRLLAGGVHQPGVDLVGLEQVVTSALVLVAHRHPAIGHDRGGAFDGLERVARDHDPGALALCPAQEL